MAASVGFPGGNCRPSQDDREISRAGSLFCQFSFVRDDHSFLENELEASQIINVIERICIQHNQIRQLAHLDRAKFAAHAAYVSTMTCCCNKRLPRCRTIAHPKPKLEQCCIFQWSNVRAKSHLDAS